MLVSIVFIVCLALILAGGRWWGVSGQGYGGWSVAPVIALLVMALWITGTLR